MKNLAAQKAEKKSRLTDEDIETIVAILEVWEGPLTWELLVQRVAIILSRSYSRQAFDSHETIKASYQARKRRNRAVRDSIRSGKVLNDEVPPELAAALQRAEAAELRIATLEQIVNGYREKFVKWLYHARNSGITEERLNAALPATNQVAGALWSRRKMKG